MIFSRANAATGDFLALPIPSSCSLPQRLAPASFQAVLDALDPRAALSNGGSGLEFAAWLTLARTPSEGLSHVLDSLAEIPKHHPAMGVEAWAGPEHRADQHPVRADVLLTRTALARGEHPGSVRAEHI